MRENATEIKKVLDEHQYSINAIIFEVMGTFKLKSIIRKAGFAKQDGYGVAEILALMITRVSHPHNTVFLAPIIPLNP